MALHLCYKTADVFLENANKDFNGNYTPAGDTIWLSDFCDSDIRPVYVGTQSGSNTITLGEQLTNSATYNVGGRGVVSIHPGQKYNPSEVIRDGQ